MKTRIKIPAFVLSLAFSFTLSAQPGIEQLMKRKPQFIAKWDSSIAANQYLLKMDFSGNRILNPEQFKTLYSKNILQVDLYYTLFAVSDSFNQGKLNKHRLTELKKLIPTAFSQTDIKWRFIAQTALKTEEEGPGFFHGFVITYRETDFIDRKSEIVLMDSVIKLLKSEAKDSISGIDCRSVRKYKKTPTGKYLPKSKRKMHSGVRYDNRGIWGRKQEYLVTRTHMKCDTIWGTTISTSFLNKMVGDSVVLRTFDRNRELFRDMVVVTDVTGSMYPYIMQLEIWMRLNFLTAGITSFVFFNDGDNAPDNKKIIGKTGGIYTIKTTRFESMDSTCSKAMTSGGGGDGPENDIEALLMAQKTFPYSKGIVLIADNYAPVKDIKLLKQINKPVHVILCGGYNGYINIEYLDLARATGGSIHTIEEDILELSKMSEGKTITISGKKYIIESGKFKLDTSLKT